MTNWSASFREPQSYGIPRASKKVRRRHIFEGDQWKFRHRAPFQRDLDDAHALRARNRRDQWLLRFQRQREIAGFSFGKRQITIRQEAGLYLGLRAFPHP